MKSQLRFALALAFWITGPLLLAQIRKDCATDATTSLPCVDKVDPPDWWATLPSPRLLLHGEHLDGTRVSVSGKAVSVTETKASSNGHYLFVQLNTQRSSHQALSLRLTNGGGTVTIPFTLQARQVNRMAFQGFSSNDVMYLIMPDRFADGDTSNDPPAADRALPSTWHGGDLRGIEQHLDYLHDLGVTTVWVTPIVNNTPQKASALASSPAVAPQLPPAATPAVAPGGATGQSAAAGTSLAAPPPQNRPSVWPPQPYPPEPAQANATRPQRPNGPRRYSSYHGYGATDLYAVDPHLGTLADFQHLADAVHARGMKLVLDTVPNHVGAAHPWAKDEPAPDWFHGTPADHTRFKTEFYSLPDPHSPYAEQKDIFNGWFGSFPDLNQENPLVSQYLIQNAMWWIEKAGLDGFRIDTFPYVGRRFWQDYHGALHNVYPNFTTVGEVFVGDPLITSYYAGGVAHDGVDTGLWTPFDFPIYETLRKVLAKGEPMYELENILRQDRLYPHPERLVLFFGNHDTSRLANEPGVTAADEKMAVALISTMRGMPQLYAGDEIAMKGGHDPDNRRDFPGGFPGDAHDAFSASGRDSTEADMFTYVRDVLHLRAGQSAILSGQQQDLFHDETVFGFIRADDIAHGCLPSGGARVLVLANHGKEARSIELPVKETALEGCSVFTQTLGTKSAAALNGRGSLAVKLAPGETHIYVVR